MVICSFFQVGNWGTKKKELTQVMYKVHGSFYVLEFSNSNTVRLIADILMITEMFTSL